MVAQEAINIIIDIEKNVEVDEIEFKGIKVWPLIRLQIWKHLTNTYSGNKAEEAKKTSSKKYTIKYFVSKLTILFIYVTHYLFNRQIIEEKDVVFLSSPNNRWERVDGKYFRPFSNSLQDILKQMDLKSIIFDTSPIKMSPIYGEPIFIKDELEIKSAVYRMLDFLKRPKEIIHWDSLIKFINRRYPDQLLLSEQSIKDMANNVIFCSKIFKSKLEQIKPKIGFLVCFYTPVSMAYIKACRDLGIKTVEIQHSQQNLNGMYAPWIKLPKNGYSLLPSYWWCWGIRPAENINAWSKNVYPEHRALVGGNPWLAKNLVGDYKIDYPNISEFNKKFSTEKIKVLVAMQPIEPLLPDNLLEVLRHSPKNVNWFFRLHPAIKAREDEIRNIINKTQNKNVELDHSSKMPLFNLLKKVDFLITAWSGVAYEALIFGVHPIIIHPEGKNAFKEYIGIKLFTYASSPQEIINTLKFNKKDFTFKEDTPYMETNIEKMKRLISDLLSA